MSMTTEQIRALVGVLHSHAERFAGMANTISQNRLISPHEREWFDGAAHGMESAAAAIEVAWLHTDNDEKTDAEVWDEGCTAGEQYYKRTVIGVPGLSPIPAPVNPYREGTTLSDLGTDRTVERVKHTHTWVTAGYGGYGWYLRKCSCGERSIG